MSIKKDTIPPKIHDGTTKSLRTTLKESKNGDNNKISYNIQSNKSNKKFKEIIMNKIENNATHNLIHNPNIQRHNKKPLPTIDSHNNVNPDIKWECSMCTYMNLSIMKYCEICETPKQSNNNNDNKENKDCDGDIIIPFKPFNDTTVNNTNNDINIANKIQADLEAQQLAVKQKSEHDDELIVNTEELVVYGYIRRNCCLAIPDVIQQLCTSFYDDHDEWSKNCHPNIRITSGCNFNKIDYDSAEDGSALLKNVVSDGKYEWKFRIEWMESFTSIGFGIWNNESIKKKDFFPMEKESGYMLVGNGWRYELYYAYDDPIPYDVSCKINDIILMKLDLVEDVLLFTINGKNYWKACDIKHGDYKGVVFFSDASDSTRVVLLKSGYVD